MLHVESWEPSHFVLGWLVACACVFSAQGVLCHTEIRLSRQERCCWWWWHAATMRTGCLTLIQIPSLKSEVLSVLQIWLSRQDAHCRCWYVIAERIGCLSRRCLRPTPTKVSLQWYVLQALSLTLSNPRYAEVPYMCSVLERSLTARKVAADGNQVST